MKKKRSIVEQLPRIRRTVSNVFYQKIQFSKLFLHSKLKQDKTKVFQRLNLDHFRSSYSKASPVVPISEIWVVLCANPALSHMYQPEFSYFEQAPRYSSSTNFLIKSCRLIVLRYHLMCSEWVGLFFFIFCLFNRADSKQMFNIIFLMTGLEPRTSGVRSNRSTNWATTTVGIV